MLRGFCFDVSVLVISSCVDILCCLLFCCFWFSSPFSFFFFSLVIVPSRDQGFFFFFLCGRRGPPIGKNVVGGNTVSRSGLLPRQVKLVLQGNLILVTLAKIFIIITDVKQITYNAKISDIYNFVIFKKLSRWQYLEIFESTIILKKSHVKFF